MSYKMIEFTFRVNTNVVKNKATSSSSCRNQRHLGSNNQLSEYLMDVEKCDAR